MINNSRIDSYIIIMIMLLAKFFALLRDIFISKNYGITYIADAYNISYIVAITIFGFIGVAITNSLTPVLSKIYNNEKEKINLIISNIFTTLGLSSILITIICLVFSDKIVLVLGGGLDTSTLNLAIDLVEISIFSIIFLTLNSILNAILRVNNYFKTPVLGDLVLNFPCLLYLIFFSYFGVKGLTFSLVIGYIFQCLIQIPALYHIGFKYKFNLSFKEKYVLEIIKAMPPMIVSSSILQLSIIIDNKMASYVGEGGISALSIANKLNGLIFTVFATSLIQISYSQMSNVYAKTHSKKKVLSILKDNINKISVIIVPTTVATLLLCKEIIQLLFMRGSFDIYAVHLSSIALFSYTIGLIFYILRDILNYAFFAIDMKKIPIYIGIISVSINILLNLILSNYFGLRGIALATSISAIFSCVCLLIKFNKLFGQIKVINYRELFKVIVSAGCMALTIIIYKLYFVYSTFSFISLVIICILQYFLLLIIFRHNEIWPIINYINRRKKE